MLTYDIQRTQFTVGDFLDWQRDGSLILSPSFQRRPVWKPDHKSYLIDTVVRGLPIPIVFLRKKIDLDSQRTIREVVDGQQRLRTMFSFIEETVLTDFDPEKDRFLVNPNHNADLGGKPFKKLPAEARARILGYQFSTHVLPTQVDDREVLQIFARMNSTGVKANQQELRNAQWFGLFKSLMYRLAYEQLERWRNWSIFTEDQIARMKEVEFVSDAFLSMLNGLSGKTHKRLDDLYKQYDEAFPNSEKYAKRFRKVMNLIEEIIGTQIKKTAYKSEVHFFTLFVSLYETLWGLGSSPQKKNKKINKEKLKGSLLSIGEKFAREDVPDHVLDAIHRASADFGRRQTRMNYLLENLNA